MGIYDEAPPLELAPAITAVRISDSRAAQAAAWITTRTNDALQCYTKLPFAP